LTLLADHALAQADTIVFDALVDERILDRAAPDAERIDAGKRGGRPSANQADISERLVALARAGRRVLRLKGGDPCVFGRGGEEALALAEAGIPFRIVPGITAGIGGLAYAGIPATQRNVNTSITFVTGHTAADDVPGGLDWTALADGSEVLVLYMALGHLGRISALLAEAGRPADEPVAVISRATTPEQTVLVTTLGDCAAAARDAALKPPAIVVIGQTVSLHERLDWFGALSGSNERETP
jgi:uroporphyrin-III C-methyltransferase